jgi:hypothetical protein
MLGHRYDHMQRKFVTLPNKDMNKNKINALALTE